LLAWSDGTSHWHCHAEHGCHRPAGFCACVNHCSPSVSVPLHLAASISNPKLVSWLISNDAGAESALDDGTTALHCACQTSDGCNMATVLLEHMASLVHRTRRCDSGVTDITVLHDTSKFADLCTICVLLKHFVDINAVTNTGLTALHIAAKRGHADIVAALLSHGARTDVPASDVKGSSVCPMHCAVEHNHPDVVARLLNAGASANAGRSYSGWENVTCLHLAAMRQNVEMVRQLLCVPFIDANACDSENATALHVAARCGFADIAELLLQHGVDVGIGMTSGQSSNQTALHCAVRYRHMEVARMLLAAGADANATEKMAACKVPSGELIIIIIIIIIIT